MFRLNKKAQSTLEYAILIFVVVGALIAMQIYVKRGIQGRMRESTDQIGEQYSPGATGSNYTIQRNTSTKESFGTADVGAGVTKREYLEDSTNRTGSESVGTYDKDYNPYANTTTP